MHAHFELYFMLGYLMYIVTYSYEIKITTESRNLRVHFIKITSV